MEMSKSFLGQINMFAAPWDPTNWANPQGQLLEIAQHQDLYSLIGNTYGGDGRHTFGLPKLAAVNDVNYAMNLTPTFPGWKHPEGTIGEIVLWTSSQPPRNWEKCDGQLLQVANNKDLYSIIGTTYGQDGPNTFKLPNLTAPNKNMMFMICVNGSFSSGGDDGKISVQGTVGCIEWWPSNVESIDQAWLPCDGRTLEISMYEELYAIIGTVYPSEGRTTFDLPKLTSPSEDIHPVICYNGVYPERM